MPLIVPLGVLSEHLTNGRLLESAANVRGVAPTVDIETPELESSPACMYAFGNLKRPTAPTEVIVDLHSPCALPGHALEAAGMNRLVRKTRSCTSSPSLSRSPISSSSHGPVTAN